MTRSGSKGISQSTAIFWKIAGDTPNDWAARYWKHRQNATKAKDCSSFREKSRNYADIRLSSKKNEVRKMRLMTIATVLASLAGTAVAAPSWQNISAESGRRIELDRSTLKREGNVVEAQSRVTLERELIDNRTGSPYRIIEAVTRYDCSTRSAHTIRRTLKVNDKETLREEEVSGAQLPVRSGTLDYRVLREVCRPPKESQPELAQKANEAASKLKQANDAMLKQETAAAPKSGVLKAVDTKPAPPAAPPATEAAGAPIPSIRPNFKPNAEAAVPAPAPAAAPAAPAAAVTPPKPAAAPKSINVPAGTTQIVRNNTPSTQPAPRPAAREPSPVRPEKVKMPKGYWSYDGDYGPAHWATLDPRYKLCGSGKRQSPIDIRDGNKVDQEIIRFDYRPSTFRIVDNGHSVSVGVSDNSFSLTGKSYTLEDIHFRSPAEMLIKGQRAEMSVHLVHRAKDGSLAVVAVMLEPGTEHPELQILWNYMPMEKNKPQQPPGVMFTPSRLLPDFRNYTSFMGSLTTPPCTEGVLWLVMQQPVQVSDAQIRMFRRLYTNNARPVQPIGDRLIKEGR
jgi:carbonic anhydrase